MNNKGAWSSDSTYNEGDYVFDRSTTDALINSMWIFQGTPPFTSATQPYLDADNWVEFEAPEGPPGDPASDDQTLSVDGHDLTISEGNTVPLPDSVIDDDADPANEIQDLQLTDNDLSITNNASATNIDLSPYLDNTDSWSLNGDSIYYMGSVGVGTSTPASKMAVQGDDVASEDPLFEVKRKDGQTVFAVYNEGVRVFVDTSSAKGPKGGFAVGGFSASKGISQDYMRITPDSVRVYVDKQTAKGPKGGFAVGGFSASKASSQEFLRVTPDSVRVYIDETISKGPKGGFAVGGFSPGKAVPTDLMSLTKENYFIGHNSGSNITTGRYNSFFGYQAGMANSTGSNNIFLGYKAGTANIGASENIFIGNESGFKTSTGGYGNVYIGNKSGHENTGGYYNSFVGYESGFNNTTHFNSFFGYQSGYSNTTGSHNSFIGYKTGYSNKIGSYNSFIGHQAGMNADSGTYNVFIGPDAGYNNKDSWNIFIGVRSGYTNTSGHFNSFVGYKSGESNTIARYNAFFGHRTGRYNTEGEWNAFYGFQAGYHNTIGDYNSFFGPNSGFYNTDGSNNSFLGYRAGMGNYTGSNNTYIGYQAGYSGGFTSNASGSDNVFIGLHAGFDESGDDQLVIENNYTGSDNYNNALIYGDFASDYLKFNSDLDVTGDINFGDTSPQGKFNIGGNGGSQGVMVVNRFTNDGILIRFRRDGATKGDISVLGDIVSYNAFTGSHYAWAKKELNKGVLVTLTGDNKYFENNPNSEIMYGIEQTNIANDPKVLGAYLSLQNPDSRASNKNPHMVMAVGNGTVWVIDNGENLNPGDYLISSDITGHAMKDNNEYDISYIIGKVAEPVVWENVTESINGIKHKRVSVFFNSFVRNHKAEKLEKSFKEAIKEQQKQIEELKKEIEAIKKEKQ